MLDVDHFKAINDTYGHPTGDQVLQAVSALLTKEVRPEDVAVRYGGEEFVVLLPETPHDGALVAAERIRNTLATSPIAVVEGRQVTVTASIGVASFPKLGDTQDTLIAAADRALYAAKQAGRNRVR
ncbi:MAG: GGDEF domain-containing protein [Gammaproteobacteria bacterium]|nr:GGDEF domain-containing protein [Gammaproteobacteria bacterium]